MSIGTTTMRTAWVSAAVALVFAGCDGSGSSSPAEVGTPGNAATLVRVEYGRLVDIYAFQRINPSNPERRATTNRTPVLVERDVLVSPTIETQELFDAVGEERSEANYRFLPFDVNVGHEELVILWDNQNQAERDRFDAALSFAKQNLVPVADAYRNQNTNQRPIPVIPRNAAIRLVFDAPLGVTSEFFSANPGALQVLRFRDDPDTSSPQQAFEPARYRVVVDGNTATIDTTLIGAEAQAGAQTTGLEPSEDNRTANYRIAMPTTGIASNQFSVESDRVPQLNGVDSRGDSAVIRDFRSGNLSDGKVGALTDVDAPTIQAEFDMGITAIDAARNIITLNKRGRQVAVRARVPFVDGGIDPDSDLPGGPSVVPTIDENGNAMALPSGDFILQDVLSSAGEIVTLRAEILENLDVGRRVGDATFGGLGLARDGSDGGEAATVRVRVSTLKGVDSRGNAVSFEANQTPAGENCKVRVRYYEHVRYDNQFGAGGLVSDAERRAEFMLIEPAPPSVDPNTGQPLPLFGTRRFVDPNAGIAVRFSEPMDLAAVSPLDNMLVSTTDVGVDLIDDALAEPKLASLSFMASRLIDQAGDGTLLKVQPARGHYHEAGDEEAYWFHLVLGDQGVTDLAGNTVDLFDRRPPDVIQVQTSSGPVMVDVPLQSFSVEYQLDADTEENLVGSRVFRFESADEDGTPPGSVDFFGQFRVEDGVLSAAPTTRVSATADNQNLATLLRYDQGECVLPGAPPDPTTTPPTPGIPPTTFPPGGPYDPSGGPGVLYWTPSMVATQPAPPVAFQPPLGPQPFGGVTEPHTNRGSRTMMTYREDDFGLSYTMAQDLNIDVEQLHWAPWNDATVLFDVFDRYTMRLGHSTKRPDLRFEAVMTNPPPPAMPETFCNLDCTSLFSGLSPTFAENPLRGVLQNVVTDQRYVINPNNAFRADSGVKYIPYPQFERSFTWRDSRLVAWDADTDSAIGLGGAQDATAPPQLGGGGGDTTKSVSSPWISDNFDTALVLPAPNPMIPPWQGSTLARDQADFLGDRTSDHDPIALPLLVDMLVFADDSQQTANAGNQFHIAYVGPIWTLVNPGGYYNAGGGVTTVAPPWQCAAIDWPFMRIHTTGGVDPNTGALILVEPDKANVAMGGIIKDMGLGDPQLGLFPTKAGDGHLHWAQIDLVRRVSMVTFGFFDTLQPNRHLLDPMQFGTVPPAEGRPDFTGRDLAMRDVDVILDPPISAQAGGTSTVVEFRGLRELPMGLDTVYDPVTDDNFDTRGSLLNPNYACDAYRYAMPNPGPPSTQARVAASGFTPYVLRDNIDDIRDVRGFLPRYLNFRLVFENNVASNPAVSPFVRSMAIVYSVDSTSQ